MRFLKRLLKYWLMIIILLALAFWIGFFSTEFIHNNHYATYSLSFSSDVIQKEDIDTEFFLDALAKYDKDQNGEYILDAEGNKILVGYSYESVKPKDFFKNKDIWISEKDGLITVEIIASYFLSGQSATLSEDSFNRFTKVMKKVITFYDNNAVLSKAVVVEQRNGWLMGLVSLGAGFILFMLGYTLYYFKVSEKESINIADGKTIFNHPFSRAYWQEALHSVTKMKVFDLCLISILFAFQMICKAIPIPSGFANLGLGFTYLVFAFISMIYGPFWGLIIGFFSDILGFFIFPSTGPFYFGYTIQAMLTGFLYGIFFYRTKLTFSKCFYCRLFVNLIINVVLGSFLWGHVTELSLSATITYMLTLSLPKNLLYLFPQAILLFFFLRLVLPTLGGRKVIPEELIRVHRKKDSEENVGN